MFWWIIGSVFGVLALIIFFVMIAIHLLIDFGELFNTHEDSYTRKLKNEGKW